MKKIFTLCLLAGISITSLAQVQWGILAGPQLTTAKYTQQGSRQSTESKPGFQLGASCRIPFESNLYFSPAAFYSLKGYKVKLDKPAFPPDSLAIDNNTVIHTFELAFLLQYDFTQKPAHFFIKAGPSLDFQLSGKEKFTKKDQTVVEENMIFNFANYGRYGANAIVQFGYAIKNGFEIFGQYSYGLGSINNADGGPRICHRVYSISVCKYFKKKK